MRNKITRIRNKKIEEINPLPWLRRAKGSPFSTLNSQLSTFNFQLSTLVFLCTSLCIPVRAYHIEVSADAWAGMPVFLAGYYGDRIIVTDSAQLDASGKALFQRDADLCTGMYSLVIPGKFTYDLLIDGEQSLNIKLDGSQKARVTGNPQTEAYAGYLTWLATEPNRQQMIDRREEIIRLHPNTFLSRYLKALQPAATTSSSPEQIEDMMKNYHSRRRNFFANMDLSDAGLLRTPLYHETVQYYFSKFVTQQVDTLVHIAYRLLEQASGNYETFFFMSDFLTDYSLRTKIDHINRLYNFLRRNRDMIGTKGLQLIPSRSENNYFLIRDEQALQNHLESMPLSDMNGLDFDPASIKSKYRILYFWKPGCPRCLADVSKWQAALNKHKSKSCFGIAVNTEKDVRYPENRILAYEPLCVNVSLHNRPECEYIFFANHYSKIIVTDTANQIIGIFTSTASLDNFLSRMK